MPILLPIFNSTSDLHVTWDVVDTLLYSLLEDFLRFFPNGFTRYLRLLPKCIFNLFHPNPRIIADWIFNFLKPNTIFNDDFSLHPDILHCIWKHLRVVVEVSLSCPDISMIGKFLNQTDVYILCIFFHFRLLLVFVYLLFVN